MSSKQTYPKKKFKNENYDTRPKKKKTHHKHKMRVMRLVFHTTVILLPFLWVPMLLKSNKIKSNWIESF